MANPSGNHQEPSHASSSFNGGGNPVNGNSAPASAPESSGAPVAMKHNPGVAMDWTAEEQAVIEDGLVKFASESTIIRYAKIAMLLQNKTVRDVALRVRWMTKKENSKRRKEEHNLSRKSKDKKERVADHSAKSSHYAARSNVPPYAPPVIPVDNDDGISFKAIGGATGELLEQNSQVLNQVSANFATHQVQDNLSLLCQGRDNILKILNELSDMPDVMKQMPPLPVKLNEELANTILPRTSHTMQS
ncbi:hypothetical protein PanWU01x14_130360 [Parasponia andersonii]|uniref:Uncharacterized protein n=1 Tax=Parasponia andersonii TaxID=3476 RepID=A0A2P5CRC8_PARAD|nr:hypothetical protein PanWU01x14_130360 [Parasponia andersonii]